MAAPRPSERPSRLFQLSRGDGALPVVQGTDCIVALRALGEDTRARIVGLLLTEALEVGEISKRLGVSQYNVSKHLRILREAALLDVQKVGRRRLYAVSDSVRRRTTPNQVLDLGCCRFEFDTPAERADGPVAAPKGVRRTRR